MTKFQAKKKAFRDGVVFQSIAAPSLYDPLPGLPGNERRAWRDHQKRLTTPNPDGRFTGASILRFRAAMANLGEKKRVV